MAKKADLTSKAAIIPHQTKNNAAITLKITQRILQNLLVLSKELFWAKTSSKGILSSFAIIWLASSINCISSISSCPKILSEDNNIPRFKSSHSNQVENSIQKGASSENSSQSMTKSQVQCKRRWFQEAHKDQADQFHYKRTSYSPPPQTKLCFKNVKEL